MKRLLVFFCTLYLSSFALAQAPSGHIDWGPWSFDWVAGTLSEGLAIKDLSFQGDKVMEKASLPVMRVQYENDACGPYADRLSVTSLRAAEVDQCGTDPICQRTFTRDGKQWLELGAQARLGEYRIYQVFYLSDDGIIDAHMFSKGLQCITDHNHHPYWRFDIDVGDYQNDQIFTYNSGNSDNGWGSGWQLRESEFEETKNPGQDRKWYARDGVTGKGLWILPGADDGSIDAFSGFDAAGRLFRSSEDEGWRFGARGELGYGDPAEDLSGQDIVFWYVAHMFHAAAEGRDIWHSAGPRLIVGDASQGGVAPPGSGGNRAPVIISPGTQTNSLNDTVDLALSASDADGDAVSFAASGLPPGLNIDSATGRITGLVSSAGTFAVTVSASDGTATNSVSFDWTVINGTVLLSAGFTDDAETFGYRDDAFRGTAQAAYASGAHRAGGGFSGGGLEVTVGGQDDADINGMSGAWRTNFSLASSGQTTLTLRYKLTQASDYESDEYSQLLLALNGALKGQNGNDYLAQLRGDGNGGSEQTTGWQSVELDLGNLGAGNHTLDLGLYNNKKTYNDESSQAWFDDVLLVQVSVAPTNRAPSLDNPGAQSSTEGVAVSLQLSASDADGDTLSYSASGLPAGLSLNTATGLISGTPTTANSTTVTANVSDAQSSSSVDFSWTVSPAQPSNTPPSLSSPGSQQNREGDSVSLQLQGGDADGDVLSYSASGLPSGLSISSAGLISGTLASGSAGTYTVNASVSDGQASANQSFSWSVQGADTGSSTTVERQISRGNDDVEENQNGRVYFASTDLELVSDPGLGYTSQVIGLRFLDVAIPAGATVEGAYLEFTVDEVSTAPTSLTIQAEASDNAPEFILAQNNVSSRARTGASVAWSDLSPWNQVGQRHQSPDISSVVQGVVSRSGWGSGNALALIITGTGTRTAESYNGSVSGAPRLVVRYRSAGNPPPTSTTTTIRFDFEDGSEGFSANPSGSDTATTGRWQRANPERSSYNNYVMQLDAVAEGQYALITDGRAGTSVGSYDVDAGVTTIRSPTIDLRDASSANVSLAYYLAHLNNSSTDDFLRVRVVGTTTATLLEERGAANYDNASWQSATYDLSQFVGQQVYLLIEVADAGTPSLVEAGVDNIVITTVE